MEDVKILSPLTLREWLESGSPVNILDIRPMSERLEWYIPQSLHINAYENLKNNKDGSFNGIHLDKAIPVVIYCGGGRMSKIAAQKLQSSGYNTYSLDGGLKGWSNAWNTASMSFPNFEIIQFRRTGKGCLSYMIIVNNEAIIVDASLDINVYIQYLESRKATLKYVIETHIHADHLSRSKPLADYTKARLCLPIPNKISFSHEPINDTTIINLSGVEIRAIKTPGHTKESTSFMIDNKVLLSGDTLFTNGVGRPDLKADRKQAKQKSDLLFYSIQKLLALGDDVFVLPSHISQPIDFDNQLIYATIGEVKLLDILQKDIEEFTKIILSRIPATPDNYLSIVEKNIKGEPIDISTLALEVGANRCAIL